VSNGSSLNQWFDCNTMTSMIDEHCTGRVDHGKRIYALTMLALWARGQV